MSPRAERASDTHALPSRVDGARSRGGDRLRRRGDATGARAGVARLRLPEKIARTLTEGELPTLDRPVRFVVTRGQRGAVRASTLEELQTRLDAPWTEEEIARFNRKRDEQREARRSGKRRDRVASQPKRGLREGRNRSQPTGPARARGAGDATRER